MRQPTIFGHSFTTVAGALMLLTIVAAFLVKRPLSVPDIVPIPQAFKSAREIRIYQLTYSHNSPEGFSLSPTPLAILNQQSNAIMLHSLRSLNHLGPYGMKVPPPSFRFIVDMPNHAAQSYDYVVCNDTDYLAPANTIEGHEERWQFVPTVFHNWMTKFEKASSG